MIGVGTGKQRARITLAHKLRLLRFMRGWSQNALAEASGLHRTYISAVERGRRNVSLDNIERLADSLGVPIAELLDAELLDMEIDR